MDSIREHIYLAALLHDIGKFYQRADKSFSEKKNELSHNIKEMADYICPINEKGRFGYQHSAWTLQFLSEIENSLKKIPGLLPNSTSANNADSIFQLASYHHKPSTEMQALISLADWWSAGIDRRNEQTLEKDELSNEPGISWGKNRYKKIPLYSIFNYINSGNGISAFGLEPLSIDKKCFPKDIKSSGDGMSQERYSILWDKFKSEVGNLPTDSFIGYSESLLCLLRKYTWCIPSNTTDMSNVSLYDHLKTTAAFADCLYVYKQENPLDFEYRDNHLFLKEGAKPVILLGVDVSGIQKFIYNIASRKAATSLKGRSFYLQLLVDSIIQKIIQHKDINATMGHVVYSSGGNLYMLLPNTSAVKSAIKQINTEIDKQLWDEHKGLLSINMDYVQFAYDNSTKKIIFGDNSEGDLGQLWKALADKLNVHKTQKFKNLLLDKYNDFFEVQRVGGDVKVCSATGIEANDCVVLDTKATDNTYVLPIVKKQSELGNTLKDVDYIVTYRSNSVNDYVNNRAKIDINTVGIHNYLFDQTELIDNDADFRRITSLDTCRVKRINNTDFLQTQIKGNGCSYGFQFYGGNKQAQIFDKVTLNDRNKTFEELADGTYLGVLRMDVDNLGSIFIKGLKDSNKSFAAYSTLSFMLDYFFSGYLNKIRERYQNDVNILYSGGDDVFAIGKWDKLINFAADIRKEFREFVGREDISISGGLAIVNEKFPIAKAAEISGEAEERAKKDRDAAKNAFNLFGETIAWKDEFDYVKSYKEQFIMLINEYNMSKGILHKIMLYSKMIQDNKKKVKQNKQENFGYIWHTSYYLTRYIERYNNEIVKAFCRDLRDNQLRDSRKYELMSIAARWAELELKENKKYKS